MRLLKHTHPQLHTSMAGEYLSSPSSSSGGRYHSVITLLVYGRLEISKNRLILFHIQTYAVAFPIYKAVADNAI